MSAISNTNHFVSVEDYLAQELITETKHEYIDGAIYAMVGASKNHESICGNVLAEIRQHLKNTPCRLFGSDVKVKAGNHFFYPDVMVVCEDKIDNTHYTESPRLLVEVLSKATRRTDETTKRTAYQALPSVMEYVLIEQDFVDVEVCRRSSGWIPQHYFLGDDVWFESLDFKLVVAEIYRWVENEDMMMFLQASEPG
jgi:Uma2 family endonuclease